MAVRNARILVLTPRESLALLGAATPEILLASQR
jgi:hypothetical protein